MIGLHEVTTSTEDGHLVKQHVGCRGTDARHHIHLDTTEVADGKDGTRPFYTVKTCTEAEDQRRDLLARNQRLEADLAVREIENGNLQAENTNLQELLLALPQIIFHAGPAFRALLAEELSPPDLTDDGTAVKLSGVLFTVLITNHGRRLIVHDISGNVDDLSLPVVKGRLSVSDQTTFIGHVARIKRAATEGMDPITGEVSLAPAHAATQSAA